MKCSECGKENVQGAVFCANCGAQLTRRSVNVGAAGNRKEGYESFHEERTGYSSDYRGSRDFIPAEYVIHDYDPNFDYTPLKMWSYFGWELLFMLPLVGFILKIVFSFGGTKNINLRNYARSKFCVSIILVGIIVFFYLVGAIMASSMRFGY